MYAPAQISLAFAYHQGLGVKQDDNEAVRWWRLASEQGNAQAHYHLGSAYEVGIGVASDKVIAYMWFEVAKLAGDLGASAALELLEMQLTQAEIERARSMAQTCANNNYSDCGE